MVCVCTRACVRVWRWQLTLTSTAFPPQLLNELLWYPSTPAVGSGSSASTSHPDPVQPGSHTHRPWTQSPFRLHPICGACVRDKRWHYE